jgi:hypothetical protein
MEAWYDKNIAPELLALCKQCEEHGLPFLAVVGWRNESETVGETSTVGTQGIERTVVLPEGHAPFFGVLNFAAQCWEDGSFNVDKFMLGLMRMAESEGHSSMILKQLGVPSTPGDSRPEGLTKLDAEILRNIRAQGWSTAGDLERGLADLGLAEAADIMRAVDRSLQKLKRQKLITFDRAGKRWIPHVS